MKRLVLFTFLSLFFIFSLSAQVEESGLTFSEKRQLRKALKVEAYTQDGNQQKGYLYYADAEKIYLTKNPLLIDSLIAIQAEDLYQIKVISHIPFSKRFLGGITFSAAVMSLITAEIYSHGDAIMIGPDFVIIAGTAFFGTPFSFLTAALFPNERTDFEFRSDGHPDAFMLTSKFLEKRRISSIHPDMENVISLSIVKNPQEVDKVLDPNWSLHPEATKNIHFSFGVIASLFDLGKQLDGIFTNAQGISSRHYGSDRISFTRKMQVNSSNNIRPYLSITFGETGYGSGVVIPEHEQEISEYIYVDYSIFYAHLGVDYVLNPINNMALSSFEFSFGGGLTYAKLDYDYDSGQVGFFPQTIKKSYISFGLQLGGRVDYYVSRNLSLNLGLTTGLLYPMEMSKMHYKSVNLGTLVFDGGSFNVSNGQVHFGLGLHF
jgi:hypothetical protein